MILVIRDYRRYKMADLIAAYAADNTLTNVGANYRKNGINNSGVGREFIVSVTADADTLTDAKLNEAIDYLTTSHGTDGTGDSAATIGAIGTADGTAFDPAADTVVYVRLQTSADFTVTAFNAAQANTTLATVCEFKPAK